MERAFFVVPCTHAPAPPYSAAQSSRPRSSAILCCSTALPQLPAFQRSSTLLRLLLLCQALDHLPFYVLLFQRGKSSVQEYDAHGLGYWWARKASDLVKALL
ncbi:unnamed protein product [Lactuca virosa]|uniref:Uncharacterized protein n=1 Tax=Lactuca virosa TaxID=75947 RepID=A0AAU9M692_9ASTR|nr:unnamed protein product [Lactuca virosa]